MSKLQLATNARAVKFDTPLIM